jgi:hypothetical protein
MLIDQIRDSTSVILWKVPGKFWKFLLQYYGLFPIIFHFHCVWLWKIILWAVWANKYVFLLPSYVSSASNIRIRTKSWVLCKFYYFSSSKPSSWINHPVSDLSEKIIHSHECTRLLQGYLLYAYTELRTTLHLNIVIVTAERTPSYFYIIKHINLKKYFPPHLVQYKSEFLPTEQQQPCFIKVHRSVPDESWQA